MIGVGRIADLIKRHRWAIQIMLYATGVVLVIVGVMLLTGMLERLARFGFS